jgi:hypothetical protein
MMNLMEAPMTDSDDIAQSNGRRIMWIIISTLGIVMVGGAIAGYMAEHNAQGGGPLGTAGIVTFSVFAAMIAGLGYAIWRNSRKLMASNEPLTKRERLNRNILIGCGIGGGIVGVVLSLNSVLLADPSSNAFDLFVDSSLPPLVAIILAVFWGILMPALAWVWHNRAIDEQEASAYRDGGYYAAYAYLIGAPTWWLLWRGGLVPEPDGVAIFMLFTIIWSAVWYWKKYH